MPELPEVQTVVSQLGDKLVGKTIASVQSEWPKAMRPSLDAFAKAVIGKKVVGTRRFGKHIVIDLSDECSIVIHLKMTGHLLVKTLGNRERKAFQDPYNQYLHHKIFFTDETELAFSDMRKFGWMDVTATTDVEKMKSIASLGTDALSNDLTEETFSVLLDKHAKTVIGAFLLNQTCVSGIGNIYRSEALFRAGILPKHSSGSLTRIERRGLLASNTTCFARRSRVSRHVGRGFSRYGRTSGNISAGTRRVRPTW
jgi:formamidopyrimidine-DNA glycosylase